MEEIQELKNQGVPVMHTVYMQSGSANLISWFEMEEKGTNCWSGYECQTLLHILDNASSSNLLKLCEVSVHSSF